MFDSSFYPTPEDLIVKMVSKIQGDPKKILEPSAGKGNIVESYQKVIDGRWYNEKGDYEKFYTIEKDKNLRAILRSKNIKVIDTDFLTFAAPDKFDLIIANPPFADGDKHLLKAIDIMYNGQIIFLLNAETIKNPYSNSRKLLVRKLEELNAEIEYIQNAFIDAERKTNVEVALVNIVIKRNVEEDLFNKCVDKIEEFNTEHAPKNEVSTGKNVRELVAEYNEILNICTQTIIDYFKNYEKVKKYIHINSDNDKYYTPGTMTEEMQKQVNNTIESVRKDFWSRTLELKEVQERMTKKRKEQFRIIIEQRKDMDFTENNIRNFVINLINDYESMLTDAVLEVFDKFTIKHSWHDKNQMEKNIHYFNGWKTNKAFKCNKKVVIPLTYGSPIIEYGKVRWEKQDELRDIDIVMNYFDGKKEYKSIIDTINENISEGKTSGIKSTYFTITYYKKGTIHLTFNDDDILRRFNIAAAKGKNFLPCNYGESCYNDLTSEEKSVIDSFEGKKEYEKNLNRPLFAIKKDLIRIGY
jgi:methylase of polypeptide subunit release factors